MAVVLQSQPEAYGLAHNDNPFVFFSTAYTPTQRFKVAILPVGYPTIPTLSTARVYPRQAVTVGGVVQLNKAFYDPSRILQSQVAAQIAIPANNHAGVFDAPNIHTGYNLLIQEEDKVNGVYVAGASLITNYKRVWNGSRRKLAWLSFDYEDYDTSQSANKFLTDAPSVQYINSKQSAFLYFLTASTLTNITIKSYDSDGVAVSTGTIDASAITDNFGYVACGPYDIGNSAPSAWLTGNPATILVGASYYTVNTALGGNSSQLVTYHIDARCSKYEPIRLHWLNRLGGFDSFNFSLKSEVEADIKRSSYLQEEHDFTGTNWQYDTMSRGTTDYHVGYNNKLTVNTDYLTEDESVWMEDFATSPVVYQELSNGLFAMSGKPKRIKKQTSLNDKLMQYEFELEYSLTNSRQRG